MANSNCTEPGPGTMDFYIMLCTVHTTPRPGMGQEMGMGMGTNGFHTHFPIPCQAPCLVPVPDTVYIYRAV